MMQICGQDMPVMSSPCSRFTSLCSQQLDHFSPRTQFHSNRKAPWPSFLQCRLSDTGSMDRRKVSLNVWSEGGCKTQSTRLQIDVHLALRIEQGLAPAAAAGCKWQRGHRAAAAQLQTSGLPRWHRCRPAAAGAQDRPARAHPAGLTSPGPHCAGQRMRPVSCE